MNCIVDKASTEAYKDNTDLSDKKEVEKGIEQAQ
jgi:hypothetical protein